MLSKLLIVALSLESAAAMAFATCADTGTECTGGTACCHASDSCEAVNQYYSKCVTQPTCAAEHGQCAGKGDTVMKEVPCCDAGFECVATNEWYSSCQNASVSPPPPSPPAPPPATCAKDEAQCGGGTFNPLACCEASSTCMVVNQYYSKCVAAETCAADNALCEGTGDHAKPATACCSADHSCVQWGADWKVCRDAAHATCSAHGEQCAGTGGSAMPTKGCCDPGDECVVVNKYYSKCDSKANGGVTNAFFGALSNFDSCPGLDGCPTHA
uniref:CBM1 domain-containing protein n=1 Tax=Prymnesium polylepis TaxID=72548 RepID=A0A7S4M1I7_9EUKA